MTIAPALPENARLCLQGGVKGGPFELTDEQAKSMLAAPLNPNGRPNSDVVRRSANAIDVIRRPRNSWVIDFGTAMSEADAALYEKPYEYALEHVKPVRNANRRERRRVFWWIHAETHPAMRTMTADLPRILCTPRVAQYRVFAWLPAGTLPDTRLYVFGRADDYFFGILQSRAHEVWSLRMASQHGGERTQYNNTICFETFPLPWSPGSERDDDPRVAAIAEAAAGLDRLRVAWLNPAGAMEAELKKRTLTNLYNARPTWLANAHQVLDAAVWSAYGWDDDPVETTDEEILTRLLTLNREPRSRVEPESIARTPAAAS